MKASLAEEEVFIVKESLRRELALSEAKMNLIREELEGFEKRYEMSSDKFVAKFEHGELGDEQDYFEWWGLVRGLRRYDNAPHHEVSTFPHHKHLPGSVKGSKEKGIIEVLKEVEMPVLKIREGQVWIRSQL